MIKNSFFLKISRLECKKPYPSYDQNGRNQQKSILYLWPKQPQNHTLWSPQHLYSEGGWIWKLWASSPAWFRALWPECWLFIFNIGLNSQKFHDRINAVYHHSLPLNTSGAHSPQDIMAQCSSSVSSDHLTETSSSSLTILAPSGYRRFRLNRSAFVASPPSRVQFRRISSYLMFSAPSVYSWIKTCTCHGALSSLTNGNAACVVDAFNTGFGGRGHLTQPCSLFKEERAFSSSLRVYYNYWQTPYRWQWECCCLLSLL